MSYNLIPWSLLTQEEKVLICNRVTRLRLEDIAHSAIGALFGGDRELALKANAEFKGFFKRSMNELYPNH